LLLIILVHIYGIEYIYITRSTSVVCRQGSGNGNGKHIFPFGQRLRRLLSPALWDVRSMDGGKATSFRDRSHALFHSIHSATLPGPSLPLSVPFHKLSIYLRHISRIAVVIHPLIAVCVTFLLPCGTQHRLSWRPASSIDLIIIMLQMHSVLFSCHTLPVWHNYLAPVSTDPGNLISNHKFMCLQFNFLSQSRFLWGPSCWFFILVCDSIFSYKKKKNKLCFLWGPLCFFGSYGSCHPYFVQLFCTSRS